MMRLKGITRWHAGIVILTVVLVVASVGGRPNKQDRVRKLELESDRARRTLANMMKENRDPRGRAKTALAKLNDGVCDKVPFLIGVNLGCTDQNQPELFLTCLDEGRNLRGIHVREEWVGANGKTPTVEERYPLYMAWPETNVLVNHMFPVELRRASQRKDEDAWKNYLILVLEDLVRKFIYEGPADEAIKVPPSEALDRKMPSIWISIPEPNQVRVFVSVYDREGQESEAVAVGISPRVYRILGGNRGRETGGSHQLKGVNKTTQ